ncbi:MAG: hypothetical protein HETSPECPRED_000251 [Heterodermia speciosa]|uniref:Uncharacterized protein n=1 Tax=Heterodermia speciosa TaxID=116794 RepID=A0A8H3I3P4_9LECA|nr:MAG: hypothetical protein HETSPECPRED_000251 [Heterodermia speciosa]
MSSVAIGLTSSAATYFQAMRHGQKRYGQGDSICYSRDAILSLALRCLYKREKTIRPMYMIRVMALAKTQVEIPKIAADSCRADDSALLPDDGKDLVLDGLDWRKCWHAKLLARTDFELSELPLVCFASQGSLASHRSPLLSLGRNQHGVRGED